MMYEYMFRVRNKVHAPSSSDAFKMKVKLIFPSAVMLSFYKTVT
jgi:hypothetical protein